MVAVTAQLYSVPLTRLVNVIGDEALVAVNAFGLHVAVYAVIAALPALTGGAKVKVTRPLSGAAVPMMGAPGAAPVMLMA